MISRILIDTNILLDYLMTREPFYESAKEVVLTCVEGKAKGCVAAEDCLQMECAKAYGAEYIVTRNISDYNLSDIKAVLPKDYLAIINMER